MKVVSVNTGRIREVEWKGRKITTGIFKEPVSHPVLLTPQGVVNDEVADRKVHGGMDKACYLYSADRYPYWAGQYPELDLTYGIFGENLTIEGLDEGAIYIGDQFQVGEAVVQVSQPRLPCYKLGIRFGNSTIVRQFQKEMYPGVYVRVIKEGRVKSGDNLTLLSRPADSLTVREVFSLFAAEKKNLKLRQQACALDDLAEGIKRDLL